MPGGPARIVVDTGPLVALFDAANAHHARVMTYLRASRSALITTTAVITEAMYVLEPSQIACRNLLTWIKDGGVELVEVDRSDLTRVIELMDKYADLPMDFADAVLVTLCERLGTKHLATVDRDFEVYRYRGREKFINVLCE
jgi:hypothetical protein